MKKQMTANEKIMLHALKEAFLVITYDREGVSLASVMDAIEMFDPGWVKKNSNAKRGK